MKVMQVMGIFVFLLILAASSPAQFYAGAKGGFSISDLYWDPNPGIEMNNEAGFAAGLFIEYRLFKNFSVSLEPQYVEKGAQAKSTVLLVVDYKFKFNYLQVPFNLKFAVPTKQATPYILAGPVYSYNVYAKLKISAGDYKANEDFQDFIKKSDLGANVGAGVSFPLRDLSWLIEGRYTFGLSDINNDPELPDTKIKTGNFQILLGIAYPL
jgi:opacity protein-like surface antigen